MMSEIVFEARVKKLERMVNIMRIAIIVLVVFMFADVLSQDTGSRVIFADKIKARAFVLLGPGDQPIGFWDNKDAKGVYNLTAPELATNNELAKELGKAMKRPSFLRIPKFILSLALGEASTVLLDGQRPYPKRLLKAGFDYKFPNIRSALLDLI